MGAIAELQPKYSDNIDPRVLCAAVDAFPQALAIVDRGHIAYGNRAFARLCGCDSIAPVVGRTLGDLHAQLNDDARQLQTAATKFAACDRSFQVVSARFSTPIEAEDAGQEPSQNLETVGRLVGSVAHDFNNLLTGILLTCDLLLLKLDQNSPLRRYAYEMRTAGCHGTGLIQQLLTIARPGKLEIGLLSWNELIEDIKNLLSRLLGENIELTTDLDGDLNLVEMDASQARQILLNLVLNARDAMPNGGQISLKTRNCVPAAKSKSARKKGGIELQIKDTGSGMDVETCSRIFEPFFTTKKNNKGTGLGLPTVKSIVKQYKGSIAVDSEPGKGTRVCIRLPGAQADRSEKYLHRGKIV